MAKAHVYLAPGANVETTDTFASWIDTTNQLVYDMGTTVLTSVNLAQPNTAIGGYTSGNAHLQGILSANTIAATQNLRGGTVSAPADLIISSNVIFNTSELIRVDANTNNFNINANNVTITSNVAINNSSKVVTVTAANTTINAGALFVRSNTEITGSRVDIDSPILDVTSNTVLTAASLNANVDVITLGFNGSDVLNVNGVADFNANVNIDGIFTSTANATFSGAQTSFTNNVIIGVDTADSLTVNALLASDLLPSATTVDLGSDARPYGNVHTGFVYADTDVESLGTLTMRGTTARSLRIFGTDNTYKDFNVTFSNNSVSNTVLIANTSGVFGGTNDLYSLGSTSVRWKDINVRDAAVSNSAVITGDLAVNGGDITTTATTFNLLDTTATTVNAFGAASTITLGANTGTLTIDNPTIVSSNVAINVFNTVATTVNAFGAATALTIGATSGITSIRTPNITGATAVDLLNSGTTTLNFAGAAATLNIGNVSGAQTLNLGSASTGASTYNIGTGVTPSANTKTLNIGTGGAASSITNVNIGSNAGGTTTLNSATVAGAASTVNLWNASPVITVNAFGAATSIVMGATTGTTNVRNNLDVDGTINTDAGTIATSNTTFTLVNTVANTVNAFGVANTITIGATTGTINLRNAIVNVVGGDIRTDATTANVINTTATTVNAFGAATAVNLGATTGTLTVNNPTTVFVGNTVSTSNTLVNVFNTTATTVNAFGAATTLNLGAATGTTNVKNNLDVDGTINVDGSSITTSATSFSLLGANATTVNAFGAAAVLNLGAASGTTTVRTPTLTIGATLNAGSQTSISVFENTVATANVLNSATAITLGATTGTTTIRNATVTLNGSALTTPSTTYGLFDSNVITANAFGAATALNIGGAASTFTLGKNTGNTSVIISAGGAAGTATLDTNATTGILRIAPTLTTGSINVGSANTGKVAVLFNGDASSTSTGALTVAGGVGVAKQLYVGGAANITGNTNITGNLVVDGTVTFTNSSNVNITVSQSNINDLTVFNTLTMDTATVSSEFVPTANTTYDLGTTANSWRTIYVRDVTASSNTTANNVIGKSIIAADGVKDSVVIAPGINGTLGRKITILPPTTVSADRTLTLADGNTILQAGTMATTGNLSQFASTTSAQLATLISDETGTGALVFATSPSLTTPTIGSAGANFSGATSGTANLRAPAVAGTTTITLPTATGTLALTSDIGNGSITVNSSTGLSGSGTFTLNQAGNATITLTNTDLGSSQNIFKNIVVGANTITAATNSDTFTIAGSGSTSVTANATTKVITIASSETDTLSSVTGRGASTATAVQFTNSTAATTTDSGAVRVTGGVGIQGSLQVGADSKFYSNLVVAGNLTIEGTTTTLNTNDLIVEDKNIILGSVTTPTDVTADGGGITLKGATDKTIIWDDLNDNWTSSENWNVASGKTIKINNTTVLSATALGTGVTGSSLTSVGTITTGTWSATAIAATRGGTGQTAYAVGDLLYADTTTSLAKLADVATGNALISGGVGVAPAWGKIGLTTHVSGTLAIGNGGTGQTTAIAGFNALSPMTTLGDTIFRGSTNAERLAGNITTTKQFLSQTGTGTVSAAPVWSAVTKSDVGLGNVENTALSTWAGSTAITTLGTISSGTWSASTIATARGGTGQTTYTDGQLLIGNTVGNTLSKATLTQGQNITVTNGNGTITIAAANTNLTWTAGTTAGPTINSSTGSGAAIPSASATASGIVTTDAQTFAGVKTFNSTIAGSINGNANTATALATVRNINLTGAATGTATFNGTANADISVTISGTGHTHTLLTPLADQVPEDTTTRTVLGTGVYTFNTLNSSLGDSTPVGYWSTLAWGKGASGSAELAVDWTNSGNNIYFRSLRDTVDNWWDWKAILHSGNYNTYSPTLSGTGATGTWGISISGNAATATNATNAGNATTVTGGVYTSGNQTIAGVKTFSNNVVSSATGTAGAYTNQDTVDAPFHVNVSQTGSSYAPAVKMRSTGAGNVSSVSFGVLHNTDNTQAATIHLIQASDANNRSWTFSQAGDFVSPGDVTAFSDERLKSNIRTIDSALDKVTAMRGVYFDKDGRAGVGVIAQEVEAVIPEVVNESGEYKSVAYGNLVGVLIEAIKELKAEIEELKRGK